MAKPRICARREVKHDRLFLQPVFSYRADVWCLFLREASAEMDGLGDNEPHIDYHRCADCLSELTGISYETYNEGGHLIEFWLRPAVVALGVPLYLQLGTIRKQLVPILLSELAGCVVGILSVVYIAKEMGATPDVIRSLAPKSVTTPIAMEVTKAVGGIPSLTAAVVVCVGLMCAVCGYKTMGFARVKMGTAAHALGTATSMDVSRVHGAYASLGLTLNGIFTALLTPSILPMLNI